MTELPQRVSRHFPESLDFGDPGARASVIARLLAEAARGGLEALREPGGA